MIIEAIYIMTLSTHIGNNDVDYNEENWGVMVETESGYLGGAYKNSFDDLSIIAAKKVDFVENWREREGITTESDWEAGIMYGIVTGYKTEDVSLSINDKVAPLFGMYVTYEGLDYIKPSVAWFGNAFNLSFKYEF